MSNDSVQIDARKQRITALAIISVSSFVSAFMGSAFSVAAPVMTNPHSSQYVPGLDEAGMGWIITIYILATAMLQIPFGKIADNYGRKKIYLIGMMIFTSATLALGFMNSETTLVIFRFIQGSGAALVFATGMAILTSIFPQDKRGRAFGINIGSVYLGLTIGPSLGGVIVEHLGWRTVFFSVVPFGFIISLLLIFVLKGEWKNEKKEKIDYLGAVIYVITLFLLLYGFRSINTTYGFYLIGASILTLIIFIFWERRVEVPILELKLFKKNRFFTFANISAFLFYTATTSTALLLNYYLQDILLLSVSIAGSILIVRSIAQAILSPIGGRLSDKIEHRTITTIGVATGLLGLTLLAFVNQNTHISLVIFGLLFGGIGFGLFSSPNANSIMSSVPRKMYGMASALVGTMRTIGQSISLGFATLMFSVILGPKVSSTTMQFKSDFVNPLIPVNMSIAQHIPLLLQTIRIVFIVAVGMCVLALFASYLRGKVNFRNNNTTNQEEEINSN
ncbi:MAG: Multidrug resistance protein stp [Candidatus Heimdallarchaeota archaeon AB_125]|nr:MAG: Multidrug resistance protein stp [Candidatus Heimdallarchaeota archaeon AB_125]